MAVANSYQQNLAQVKNRLGFGITIIVKHLIIFSLMVSDWNFLVVLWINLQNLNYEKVQRILKANYDIFIESHSSPAQREYEEFKVRINALVAKAQKMPEEGWTMQDGTPWPGNNSRDHPGMIQVISIFLSTFRILFLHHFS